MSHTNGAGSAISSKSTNSVYVSIIAFITRVTSRNLVTIAFFKLLFVIFISLMISQGYQDCDYNSRDKVVESCAGTTTTACSSFCDDTSIITVNVHDDYYQQHFSEGGYCTASFTGTCSCKYFKIFKIVPILLHILQFLLQLYFWQFYFNFDPHQLQYDSMMSFIERNSYTYTDLMQLVHQLSIPYMYCIFAVLELVTAVYVWSELAYPTTRCVIGFPLSSIYYPLLMTLADMCKLNIAACIRHFKAETYGRAPLSLFSIHIFLFYCMITIIQSYIFIQGTIIQLCALLFLSNDDIHDATPNKNNTLNQELDGKEEKQFISEVHDPLLRTSNYE